MRRGITPVANVTSQGGSSAKKGGSQAGAAAGAVIGGVIGGMASGGSAALAGASAGSALGSQLGNAVSPAKAGQDAITRRIDAAVPQIRHSEQSEQLKQSLIAL